MHINRTPEITGAQIQTQRNDTCASQTLVLQLYSRRGAEVVVRSSTFSQLLHHVLIKTSANERMEQHFVLSSLWLYFNKMNVRPSHWRIVFPEYEWAQHAGRCVHCALCEWRAYRRLICPSQLSVVSRWSIAFGNSIGCMHRTSSTQAPFATAAHRH